MKNAKSLQKREQILFDIIDFLPDATFAIDQDGKVIAWNRIIEEKTGVLKEDILGKSKFAYSIPCYGKLRPCLIDLIKDESPYSEMYDFIRKEGRTLFSEVFAPLVNNGNGAYLWMKASPLLDDNGQQYGAIESICDITEYKASLKALQRSEKKYRELVDYSLLAIYETTLKGEILFANNAMIKMFGYDDFEDLKANNIVKVYNNPAKRNDFVRKLKENNYLTQYEIKGITKNGKTIDTLVNAKLHDNIVSGMITDITDLKKAEENLKKSLNEKNSLNKEIHHRVKNNLQIILSLLDLQKPFVEDDPIAINVLKGSQNRVTSMAMIHEMLYQSKDFNHINISDYIMNLIYNLYYSYGVVNKIKPVINVDDFYLNIETSIPLGLLISELVSNSLKYAFPGEKTGEIITSLKYKNTHYELVISDNGIGFPKEFDFRNVNSSLGLRLVTSLVDQLDGTIELDKSHPGTKYIIKFKELQYEKRI